MNERRLDGNAAAGVLREVFAFEMTTAEIACVRCGSTGRVGGTDGIHARNGRDRALRQLR